ncbi:uncharacterized domain 1-containing protein [Desulfacinum hydrothermale DSM 13146]|uniref:Uncharacterized domain 1-containing protein n=1 Tax=Desulfacinum hydrothermale DSM 13146 TaxID=1121390 RepID=A0A1W1X2R5_9BACT|nr:PaaI family thioesterase [Desulfacinum hydrothermale]SMC18113.1 uncharacterized domain 1-containing protein [Desulfacinum hydrothermale DSM 13146]
MKPEKMTGLELMQAMVEGAVPHPPIAETVPMRGVSAQWGRVVFLVQADQRHLNPLGGVHGGFAATVLDSVTACAVHTTLDAGAGYATIDLNVKMIRPIPLGTELTAEGTVLSVTRSLGIAEGRIQDESGTLYAFATATCMIMAPR